MSDDRTQVKFAIISNAPAASALLEVVCQEIEKRTSLAIEAVVFRSYDKLVAGMAAGEIDVAWAPPLVAIELERAQVARIALSARRLGKADYSSAIFVKRDSTCTSLKDLAGKKAAWVARESSAGYVVPRLKLLAAGLDPEKDLAEQSFRRTHEAVVRVVQSGEADFGATFAHFEPGKDEPSASGWQDSGVANADVRILAVAGPIPSDVIALSSGLADDRAEKIVTALREMGEPVRQLLNADGFDRPEVTHFDQLRELVAAARRSGSTGAEA
jgi:phosphonate transport system substrate-binding protein